jgi:hypothetical protein
MPPVEIRSAGYSGLDLLTLSASHFDPNRTSAGRSMTSPETHSGRFECGNLGGYDPRSLASEEAMRRCEFIAGWRRGGLLAADYADAVRADAADQCAQESGPLWPHELRDRIPNCNQVAHARRTC